MVWGRKGKRAVQVSRQSFRMPRPAGAVAIFGALVCVLFLCAVSEGSAETVLYPAEMSRAAVQTFLTEHTAFADAIGLNTHFPADALAVGSFTSRGEEAYRAYVEDGREPWTFGDYLRDAFSALFGLS